MIIQHKQKILLSKNRNARTIYGTENIAISGFVLFLYALINTHNKL